MSCAVSTSLGRDVNHLYPDGVYHWPQKYGGSLVARIVAGGLPSFALHEGQTLMHTIKHVDYPFPREILTRQNAARIFQQIYPIVSEYDNGEKILHLKFGLLGGMMHRGEKEESSSDEEEEFLDCFSLGAEETFLEGLSPEERRTLNRASAPVIARRSVDGRSPRPGQTVRLEDVHFLPPSEEEECLKKLGIDLRRISNADLVDKLRERISSYSSISARTITHEFTDEAKRSRCICFKGGLGKRFRSFFVGLWRAIVGHGKDYCDTRNENRLGLAMLGSEDPRDVAELVRAFKRGDHLTLIISEDGKSLEVQYSATVGEKIYRFFRGNKK